MANQVVILFCTADVALREIETVETCVVTYRQSFVWHNALLRPIICLSFFVAGAAHVIDGGEEAQKELV